MLLALLMAGVAEGIGLSALLPLPNILVKKQHGATETESNGFEEAVYQALASLGVTPSIGAHHCI